MKTLQKYLIRIRYKPDTKLKFVEALSRLYIRRSSSSNGIEPDWHLSGINNKDNELSADTTETTEAMVLKHEEVFSKLFGTLHPSFPTTILPRKS